MKKRITSLLLTLTLTLSLIPTTAIAEIPETDCFGQNPFYPSIGSISSCIENGYTYTETDYSTDPATNTEKKLDLYTISLPPGAHSVTINFKENEARVAYSYDADGNYIASCADTADGSYENAGQTGQMTATVKADANGNFPDYVRVQTPYDSNWTSTMCYAVTFGSPDGGGGDSGEAGPAHSDSETLMKNIAATYTESSGEWIVMDMAAYEDLNPSTEYKTTESAKQTYINTAISSINKPDTNDATYSKAILALTAAGADVTKLYSVNSNTPVNAITGLNGVTHSDSVWNAPYTLSAYNQGEYGTAEQEQALVTAVLARQSQDGSWTEWGDSIQSTSNMIAGLMFYYDSSSEVKTAVDKAIAYLSNAQKPDGSFDAYGSGADSNTIAMVVIALAAAGINPDTDSRFVKNDTSALDSLLSFAVAGDNGFGYTNNNAINAYSTEQSFRALIAATRMMTTGQAYNIYDFSGNDVVPARSTGISQVSKPSNPQTTENISVYFTLKADTGYWLSKRPVEVKEGSTVYHVFAKALEGTGITASGAESGYVKSITNGSTTLAEFSQGVNSGWLYKVNNELPGVGLTECSVNNGDSIVFYYTDDWTRDPSAKKYSGKTPEKAEPTSDDTTTATTVETTELPFQDTKGHWAYNAIRYAYNNKLFSGVSDTAFAPDTYMTRAMLVTALYRLDGQPATTGLSAFEDVAEGKYYTEAIIWATGNHIVNGYGNGFFGTGDNITREQLAVMLKNYADYKKYDTTSTTDLTAYIDAPDISPYALNAMKWANAEGLITGYNKNLLLYDSDATRAQVATILMRFSENISGNTVAADLTDSTAKAASYVLQSVPSPQVGTVGGEWAISGLVKSGYTVPSTYYRSYYDTVKAYLSEHEGILHDKKYTEYSRVILALTATGADPADVNGYNLLLPLGDYNKTVWQGVNGAIWALLALDSGDYKVPVNPTATVQADRQMYVDFILNGQHADGGWGLDAASDPDLTAMALTALSPYSTQSKVKASIESGIKYLSLIQNNDGGYSSQKTENAESCAQVLIALCALKIDSEDSRFIKNSKNVVDALLSYQNTDGSFSHIRGGEANQMASEQGLLALSALAANKQ